MNIGEIMLGLRSSNETTVPQVAKPAESQGRRGCHHHNKQTLDVAEKMVTEDKTWITSRTVSGEAPNKITVGRSLQYLKKSRSSLNPEQQERFDRIMMLNDSLKPEKKSSYLKKAKKAEAV